MNKVRIKITGYMQDERPVKMTMDTKGEFSNCIYFLTESILRSSIDMGIKKKDFLEYMKNSYEEIMKEINEERKEDK